MSKKKSTSPGWTACKKVLAQWPRNGVVELLHELFELNTMNKTFLLTRLQPTSNATGTAVAAVERSLLKIVSESAVLNGRFSHSEMKRIVDQFAKGVDDPGLVVRVLITDLDASCNTFERVGDDPAIANHLLAVIERLYKVLSTVAVDQLPVHVDRLASIAKTYGRSFGYGVSDELMYLQKHWSTYVAANVDQTQSSSPVLRTPEPDF